MKHQNYLLIGLFALIGVYTSFALVQCTSETFGEMVDFPSLSLNVECGTFEDPTIFVEPDFMITWTSIENAEFYEILLNDSTFTLAPKKKSEFSSKDGSEGIHITKDQNLAYQTLYKITVRGANYYQYQESPHVCFFRIVQPTPTIVPPAPVCETDSVSLSFTAPESIRYNLSLLNTTDPSTPVASPTYDPSSFPADEQGMQTVQTTVSAPAGTYYWHLESTGLSETFQATSDPFEVVRNPVQPTDLTDDAEDCVDVWKNIQLSWHDEGFGTYEVEINLNNTAFTTQDITVTGSTATWSGTGVGTADWRVRHVNLHQGTEICLPSAWTTSTFTIPTVSGSVTPSSGPGDGSAPYAATLEWTGTSEGDKYIVTMSNDGGYNWGDELAVTGLSYTYESLAEGEYIWRVKADQSCNDGWHNGDGFAITFDCTTAGVPTALQSLSDQCAFNPYNFSWDGSADEFEVQVSNNQEYTAICANDHRNFMLSAIVANATNYSFNPLVDKDSQGKNGHWHDDTDPKVSETIYWHIRARNTCDGIWSAWSTESTFNIRRDTQTCCADTTTQYPGGCSAAADADGTSLFITEILVNGSTDSASGSGCEFNEFFELYNATDKPVSLTGIYINYGKEIALATEGTYDFTDYVIGPYGWFVSSRKGEFTTNISVGNCYPQHDFLKLVSCQNQFSNSKSSVLTLYQGAGESFDPCAEDRTVMDRIGWSGTGVVCFPSNNSFSGKGTDDSSARRINDGTVYNTAGYNNSPIDFSDFAAGPTPGTW